MNIILQILILRTSSNSRDVVVKNDDGNIIISDGDDHTGEQYAAPGTGGTGGRTDGGHRGNDGRHGIVIVHEYYG